MQQIKSPYSGKNVNEVEYLDSTQIEKTLSQAAKCFKPFQKTSRYARSRLLSLMVEGLKKRRPELVNSIVQEAGKPLSAAEVEVSRCINTFTIAAEEAKRLGGEVVPVDIDPSGTTYGPATSYWVGRGPVFAICPFNFPLNLVAHKVAPALAVGVPVIVKPSPQAPGAAVILAEIFAEAADEIPKHALQITNCTNDLAEKIVTDPRIQIVSFTGSAKVGWHLQVKAVGKKIILELGGNAAVIIDKTADLQRAAKRCAVGAFSYAGQVCISVQRIFVEKSIEAEFTKLFLKEVEALPVGDPARKETIIGPVINSAAASRISTWINEAEKSGAKTLLKGKADGNILFPTILTHVKPTEKISCEEVFGPVAIVESFSEFSEAVNKVNDSKYGLQAGVFSDSKTHINFAIENLDVGGIMINEIPMYRADNMPYGGIKESGLGREGVKYTMEEYCERKVIVEYLSSRSNT